MIVNSDALTVRCPQCNAEPGQPCRAGQRTYRDGRVHTVRNAEWEKSRNGGEATAQPDEPKILEPDPAQPGTYRNP